MGVPRTRRGARRFYEDRRSVVATVRLSRFRGIAEKRLAPANEEVVPSPAPGESHKNPVRLPVADATVASALVASTSARPVPGVRRLNDSTSRLVS